MAKGKSKQKTAGKDETISVLETEKFSFVYENIPDFKSIAIGIWFPVGSRYETSKIRGISHFIEHLIFKGTKKYDAHKVSEIFDSLGAKVNAFTGKETTCYYVHLLSSNLEKALELLIHILKEPAFRKRDVESERQVILQEIAMYEDSPDELVHDYFAEAAFKGTSLGQPIIGNAKSVSSITRDDIISWYEKHYRNGRFVVSAAGSVDPETVIKIASSLDGKPKKTARQKKQIGSNGENHKIVIKDTAQTHLCIGYRIFGASHKDRFAMAVLDALFGGMMSSRLFREIREKRGLAYSTFSYATYFKEAGYICAYAGTSHDKVYKVTDIILEEYKKLVFEKVSKEELEKAKENVKSSIVLSSESMRARMTYLGRSAVSGEELLTISEIIERINMVTADDIQRIAETYFTARPVVSAIGKVDSDKLLSSILEG